MFSTLRKTRILFAAVIGAVALSLTMSATAAHAAPAAPPFVPAIDDYANYDPQDTCDPTAKPGVVDFRDLLNATYGNHTAYITRSCNVEGTSEHEEGRALDYMLDVTDTKQRAVANDVLGWLLATDQYGNQHAMARRLGIMYIIWNKQMWRAYRAWEGWQPYSGSNPHTDHIHFSFSWAGALRQTTWWTGRRLAGPVIAVDADGTQMIVDPKGQVHAKQGIGLYGWTRESDPWIKAVATNGGTQMILDDQGQVWAKNGIGLYDWTLESDGGNIAIAIGSDGTQMVLDNQGQVWAKNGIGLYGWTRESDPGVKAIATNGGVQMIIGSDGNVWAKDTIGLYGWTRESDPIV